MKGQGMIEAATRQEYRDYHDGYVDGRSDARNQRQRRTFQYSLSAEYPTGYSDGFENFQQERTVNYNDN